LTPWNPPAGFAWLDVANGNKVTAAPHRNSFSHNGRENLHTDF
jgi:hypothetical protein